MECGVDGIQSPGDAACGDKVLVWLACCDQATEIDMCIGWLTVAVFGLCWTAVVHVWWVGLREYVA